MPLTQFFIFRYYSTKHIFYSADYNLFSQEVLAGYGLEYWKALRQLGRENEFVAVSTPVYLEAQSYYDRTEHVRCEII